MQIYNLNSVIINRVVTMKKNSESKTDFGIYDDKGYWRPPYPCAFSPLFERPINMRAILKYLFGWAASHRLGVMTVLKDHSYGVSFRSGTIFTIFTTGTSPVISEHRRFPGTGGWEDFIMERERTARRK